MMVRQRVFRVRTISDSVVLESKQYIDRSQAKGPTEDLRNKVTSVGIAWSQGRLSAMTAAEVKAMKNGMDGFAKVDERTGVPR